MPERRERSDTRLAMGPGILPKIFVRSLLIQASLNFSNMQNVGFAYSLIPLAKRIGKDKKHIAAILTRHIKLFSTHPYLSGSIIGSVTKLEEQCKENEDCSGSVNLKKALMAPYAAMGDPFFWGALRPLSAILGVIISLKGLLVAPLIFLAGYNTVHIGVRLRGFIEGYRDGRGGINFLRSLNLPDKTKKVRWISVVLLAVLMCVIFTVPAFPVIKNCEFITRILVSMLMILCVYMVKKGISPVKIIYGALCIFLIIAYAI